MISHSNFLSNNKLNGKPWLLSGKRITTSPTHTPHPRMVRIQLSSDIVISLCVIAKSQAQVRLELLQMERQSASASISVSSTGPTKFLTNAIDIKDSQSVSLHLASTHYSLLAFNQTLAFSQGRRDEYTGLKYHYKCSYISKIIEE